MTGCGTKLMSSSKKLKHQQISPFAELHLRQSRSGRTLLDLPPKPSTQSPYVPCANSKHPIDENPEIFDVDERISIKDLRARRVFSLASTEQVDVEGNKKKLKSDVVIEGCDRDDCVQATPPDTAPDGLHVMKNLSSSNLNKNPKFKEKHPSFKGILFSYTSTDEEDRCLRWLILDFTIEQYYSVFSLYDEDGLAKHVWSNNFAVTILELKNARNSFRDSGGRCEQQGIYSHYSC